MNNRFYYRKNLVFETKFDLTNSLEIIKIQFCFTLNLNFGS